MIAPGSTIKSSEIKKLAAITLKNQANLYYNSELANAWVKNPDKYNLTYSVFSSSPFSTIGNPTTCVNNYNVFLHTDAKFAYAGEVYDYMEGTTVDTNKWLVTYSGGEGSPSLSQSDNSYVLASWGGRWAPSMYLTTKALNLKPSSGTQAECIFKVYLTAGPPYDAVAGYQLFLIGASGGSKTIASYSGLSGAGVTLSKIYRLVFDNGTCYVYDITSSWSNSPVTSFSTSDLSGDWQLKARAYLTNSNNSGSLGIYFYPIVYVRNNAISGSNYIAETNTLVTHTSNIDEVFLTWNGSNITSYVSSNNGANYTPAQKDDFTTISNAGTQLKLKFDFSGMYTTIPKIYSFACYYDCW